LFPEPVVGKLLQIIRVKTSVAGKVSSGMLTQR